MKNRRPAGRVKPLYSYDVQRGLIKRRRILPAAFYMLAIAISMSGAAGLAVWQAKSKVPVVAPQAKVVSAPKTIVHIVPRLSDAAPVLSLSEQDAQLESIVKQFAANHSTYQWSVQLEGLNSDSRMVTYRPNQVFRSASLYKLLLLYPLSQKVAFAKWPSVELKVDGTSRTLSDCVAAMLKVSDNPCGVAVGNYVGWDYADQKLKSIGLSSTNLNGNEGPTTTAADVSYYLQGLYKGEWFDATERSFIIAAMDSQIFRAGIPAGCISGCAVADKTGDLGFVRHDVGLVRYAGGAYVLSIFSSGASYSLIAQLAGQLQAYMAANAVS